MSQFETDEPKLLPVKVHPHLVGAVRSNVDLEGKKRFIPSALVNLYSTPCPAENAEPLTFENAYECIANRLAAVGMFSSRFVDTDEFTNIFYPEEEDKIQCHNIECAETMDFYYPHNMICCHPNNHWMFKCFQMMFWHRYGIFPHKYLNLPTIINIKRSSGLIQKGIIKLSDGIRLRQGSQDTENQLYIKVHFSNNNPEAVDSLECGYTKLIYLTDFLEVNPEVTTLQVKYPNELLGDIDTTDPIKKQVVEKVAGFYREWFSTTLVPCLEKIDRLSLQITQT